uniref:SAM-dependent methyltransferase n=1 Tax=Macrostomum lignano TaxID=282301 RepID=A0A1I8FKR3_9PLAT
MLESMFGIYPGERREYLASRLRTRPRLRLAVAANRADRRASRL